MGEILQGWYGASAAPALPRERLSGTRQADFCVIGGGYTGLSAALELAASGASVMLLEAETVGIAASGRNGGQIHTGFRKEQSELETWLGPQHARDLWRLGEESKTLVRGLIQTHGIACALKSGLVIAAHKPSAARDLEHEAEHLAARYGYTALTTWDAAQTRAQLGTSAYPASRFDAGGGHLHPLNFVRGMARAAEAAGAQLFERSRVLAIDEDNAGANARTADGTVSARAILLACDAFSAALAPQLAPYIGQLESFIVATAPLDEPLRSQVLPCDAAVADTRHVLDYYRKSEDGRMLFAGRESYWSVPKDVAATVRPRMTHVFPALAQVPVAYAWHGTVGITRTRMPHLGRLSKRMLFAHGYSGQGVALANLCGKLMAEAALGKPERFDVIARVPAERFPGGQVLRRPLVAAALMAFKVLDSLPL